MSSRKEFISIGAQHGDLIAGNVFDPLTIHVKSIFRGHFSRSFSTDIDELAIVLRVDGKVWYWGIQGVRNVRLMKIGRYISCDLFFTTDDYDGISPIEIKRIYYERLKEAIDACVARLARSKIDFEDRAFVDAVESALNEIQDAWLLKY